MGCMLWSTAIGITAVRITRISTITFLLEKDKKIKHDRDWVRSFQTTTTGHLQTQNHVKRHHIRPIDKYVQSRVARTRISPLRLCITAKPINGKKNKIAFTARFIIYVLRSRGDQFEPHQSPRIRSRRRKKDFVVVVFTVADDFLEIYIDCDRMVTGWRTFVRVSNRYVNQRTSATRSANDSYNSGL